MEEVLDFLSAIQDWFKGYFVPTLKGWVSPAIDDILDKIGSFFTTVFSWIFCFITGDFLGTISGFGITFFDTVSSSVASNISGGQFIYFVIGALISFPLLKLVIRIIRG